MDIVKILLGFFLIIAGFGIVGYCLQRKEKYKNCTVSVTATVVNIRRLKGKRIHTSTFRERRYDRKSSYDSNIQEYKYEVVYEYEYNGHKYTTKPMESSIEFHLGDKTFGNIDPENPELFRFNEEEIVSNLAYGLFTIVGGVIVLIISLIRYFK